jgi:hypothetical protein
MWWQAWRPWQTVRSKGGEWAYVWVWMWVGGWGPWGCIWEVVVEERAAANMPALGEFDRCTCCLPLQQHVCNTTVWAAASAPTIPPFLHCC